MRRRLNPEVSVPCGLHKKQIRSSYGCGDEESSRTGWSDATREGEMSKVALKGRNCN